VVVALSVLAAGLAAANLRRAGDDRVTSSSAAPAGTPGPVVAGANAVRIENARTGSRSWDVPLATAGTVEGYPSSPTVAPGETLGLHVSTSPAAPYRVEIYRLGWYGGLGARLLGCLPECSGQKQGTARPVPAPDPSGEVRAGWPVTDETVVPAEWVSGYYVAKLVLTAGAERGRAASVPFVVRAPSTRLSTILVQVPVNTWQAYNSWGQKSLYDFNSSDGIPATRVSFERPIIQERVLNYPFTWEYPLVRFLEREGYDAAYVADVDVHRAPGELQRHRLVVTAGHGEYWSKEMRDGFEAALSAGTNLAFIGANIAAWQIRYDNQDRSMIGYKSATDPIADPARKTVRFRDLLPPRPECQLIGVQSEGGLAGVNDPPRAYARTSAAADDPWFADTRLTPGTVLSNLVGYEWDTVQARCITVPLTVLFHYEGAPSNADAVRYTAPSGARVFAAGSAQFPWGLDDWGGHRASVSPGLQQFMRNALADLTGPAKP
jgi:hypothetical protein